MTKLRSLETISDGKIYDIEDWVCADAGGCEGCSACCHHVGDLVMLTPFDIFEITRFLGISFDELLLDKITLREEKKLLLPYLQMQSSNGACCFLNQEGRCTIHAHRPNICRLFPLGRIYEGDNFKYFLQVGNCTKTQLTKVKVADWIGIESYEANKAFILAWHSFTKALQFRMKFVYDESEVAMLNQTVIDLFYRQLSMTAEDFYKAFTELLPKAKKIVGIL